MRIGRQLADAVAHAHDRGIIHRDLKSGNVMITPAGRVKVLDFGLAKRIAADRLSEVTATHSATEPFAVMGTLPYMAPEQLRAQSVDARSDVWALGVMLYEMSARARPFGGRTGFEISSAILHTTPQPLTAKVPPPLESVISRCLEKEPDRRYQRGGELSAALEAIPLDATVARRRGPVLSRVWLGAAVLLIVASIATLAWRYAAQPAAPVPSSAAARPRIQSLVVLPLDNLSQNPDEEYFAAGMHEALITDLARIGLQKVIAKASADAFRGTKKLPSDIGRELGVEGIVTGSVWRAKDRVQITAQLVEASSGAVVWANKYERSAGDVMSLQNDVVGAIAREVRATLTPEQSARLTAPRPVNPVAHDAYLKGRSMFFAFVNTPFDMKLLDAAATQFEKTIQMDPTYAPPHAALSLMYLTASQSSLLAPPVAFPKARTAALRAVELDEALPEAHAALAEVNTWYDWDWAAAEREIKRALQLNPESPDALRAAVVYQTLIAAKPDEAERISQRIVAIDPLNPFSRTQPVWVTFFSRRFDDSIRHAHTLLEVMPNNIMGPLFLASNHAARRMKAEASAECGKLLKAIGDAYVMQLLGMCAWVYATVGEPQQARRLVRRLEPPPPGQWLDPAVMANVFGALGDADRAFTLLKKGMAEHSPNTIYLKAGVTYDSMRSDPRFAAALRQMNFPN
jgi:TolB-like protein